MINKKIKRLLATASAALLLALAGTPAIVMAQAGGNKDANIQGNTCQGANLDLDGTASDQTCKNVTKNSGEQANNLVATVINIFSVVVGIVSVIMIIYGGFRYITSGGESGNISAAKNTILYAIIGLVIVALAQFIVKFVLGKATGNS